METNFSVPSLPARASVTGRSVLVLVVATLLVPVAAHLSPSEHVSGRATQSVAYGYGEVTTAERVPALYRRFEREALKLCEGTGLYEGLGSRSPSDCVERVVELAVREIDAPLLTAYHETQQAPAKPARVASSR